MVATALAGDMDTFPKYLLRNAERLGDQTAMRHKDFGIWQSWTWREQLDEVRKLALGLQELGLAPSSLYGAVESLFASLDWNTGGGGGGGQPAPEKRLGQVGSRVTEVLLDAAASGRLNRRDLSDYLNLTTGQVADLASLVAER